MARNRVRCESVNRWDWTRSLGRILAGYGRMNCCGQEQSRWDKDGTPALLDEEVKVKRAGRFWQRLWSVMESLHDAGHVPFRAE